MKFTRSSLLAFIGPAAALAVTWYAGLVIANISAGKAPDAQVVSQLRTVPDDARLRELADIGVLYPRFDALPAVQVLSMAEQMFAGGYTPEGSREAIRVPFEPTPYLSGHTSWHLELQSFWTPALLAHAYEVSGDRKYITAAAQYVVDWAKYESSLFVPRGYFFNDHALAARSIVMSEVWRLYRGSEAYEPALATDFLRYAQKLSRLLLEQRLYEYRSNHGVMQCLALMHLATAFPLLENADRLFDTGWERLQLQLGFYVDAEGVILEHSPGYHVDGVKMLGAAWRLLGMNGRAVPPEWAARYRKAVEFSAALRRPDGTLPPIGDTHETGYFPLFVTEFDPGGLVSIPLRETTAAELGPPAVTLASGAGYAILRDGDAQTVLHWGNFPTHIHKHADELGLSIWMEGVQWTRAVGYWPYIASRRQEIGWRSSNAPHWVGEPASSKRSSSLQAQGTADGLSLFDVLRTNDDGRSVRRQVVRLGPGLWIVVDSFDSPAAAQGELIWRFPPEMKVHAVSPGRMELSSAGHRMNLLISDPSRLTLEVDETGGADWNSGIASGDSIVPSPAVRIRTGDGERGPVATIFALQDSEESVSAPDTVVMNWRGPEEWTAEFENPGQAATILRRSQDQVTASGADMEPRQLTLSSGVTAAGAAAMDQALGAYAKALERYGIPFEVMLERRTKITFVILALAVLQIAIFTTVANRWRRWWLPLLGTSSAAWLALCLFLHLRFLAVD